EGGANAIYRCARTTLGIEELNERLEPDPFLGKGTIAVTRFRSSAPSLCAIADGADIHVDRRLTWGETKETAIGEVEAIAPDARIAVTQYDRPGYTGLAYPQESYFPTWKIDEDHPLVATGVATWEALYGERPVVDKWTFSTNGVAICGKHGIPTIGFGPGDEVYAHAPNERTPIEHLEKASAFYAMLPWIMEEHL
ncbi:MAG: M20/M25/M40 family metallo-hydrolase, partial [Spirochaetota bacterium]